MFPLMRFKVRGKSMEPNFKEGDYLIVKKYFLKSPEVGDVVIVRYHKSQKLLIKRVINKNQDGYSVIGDNPEQSQDSRNFGLIKRDLIVGKVWLHFKN